MYLPNDYNITFIFNNKNDVYIRMTEQVPLYIVYVYKYPFCEMSTVQHSKMPRCGENVILIYF